MQDVRAFQRWDLRVFFEAATAETRLRSASFWGMTEMRGKPRYFRPGKDSAFAAGELGLEIRLGRESLIA